MLTYHILNGDCLAEQIKQTNITGEFIICRECLIEGNVYANNLPEFWDTRANHIAKGYGGTTTSYYDRVVAEFEKIMNLPPDAQVCLWFEHDLFCQINMWFILSLLIKKAATINLCKVSPVTNDVDVWKGFGIANAEMLEYAYAAKIRFEPEDIKLGHDLWIAYQQNDPEGLRDLSVIKSACFQYLEDVCTASIDRLPDDNKPGRPERAVRSIINDGFKTFEAVFAEFSVREGIYGFGDLQLQPIYDKVISTIK